MDNIKHLIRLLQVMWPFSTIRMNKAHSRVNWDWNIFYRTGSRQTLMALNKTRIQGFIFFTSGQVPEKKINRLFYSIHRWMAPKTPRRKKYLMSQKSRFLLNQSFELVRRSIIQYNSPHRAWKRRLVGKLVGRLLNWIYRLWACLLANKTEAIAATAMSPHSLGEMASHVAVAH